jgi:hypothetical protein
MPRLPYPPSNHAYVSNPRPRAIKKLDKPLTALEEAESYASTSMTEHIIGPTPKEGWYEEPQQLFESLRAKANEVCPLAGEECSHVDRAAFLADRIDKTTSSLSARQRLALSGEFTPLQQEHLAEAHPRFVQRKEKEYDQQQEHRTALEELDSNIESTKKKIKRHNQIGPDSWQWGPGAWGNRLIVLESELDEYKREWWDRIAKEKANPELLGESSRKTFRKWTQ